MDAVLPIQHPGLGNTAYLVDLGDGSALVVDPERDPQPYLGEAERLGLVIRHVAETHLHADFVSGARELVALGASLIAPRGSGLAHPHRRVDDGDVLEVGDLLLQVIESPGHTPEHVAYLLRDGATPTVLFSGGTLMAGGVARPDLIDPKLTAILARQAYHSVHRLLQVLPDHVEIRPTHGGGSFCSSAGASRNEASTVRSERATHPAMRAPDAAAFADELLEGLGSYPPYFQRLREVNRRGPEVFGVELPHLVQIETEDLAHKVVVDARPIDRFARGHIPGSVSIELRDQFATWLGWLFDSDVPLVFVLDPDQDERELIRQALNIGHENFAGRISINQWLEAGRQLNTIDLLPPDRIHPDAQILDIRQDAEWESGHVAGAKHVELGTLALDPTRVDAGVVVHCGHGQRAMTAASLLARADRPPFAVATAGQAEIARALTAS